MKNKVSLARDIFFLMTAILCAAWPPSVVAVPLGTIAFFTVIFMLFAIALRTVSGSYSKQSTETKNSDTEQRTVQ